MSEYKKDRVRFDKIIRRVGVICVMNKKHARSADHIVTTMWEIYQAGFIAECTFRIDGGLIKEAMQELTQRRAKTPANNPFVLGVGSVINPKELDAAIEMGFDLVVAPANVMGGYGEGKDFVRICRQANVFSAPAVLTPTEFQYFIERPDELEPDAVKIFPAGVHGPKGFKAMFAPFVRDRHAGRVIIPTGGVNYETGPQYQEAIRSCGFVPVLGMSAPLELVETSGKPGDVAVIRESLAMFKAKFAPAKG